MTVSELITTLELVVKTRPLLADAHLRMVNQVVSNTSISKGKNSYDIVSDVNVNNSARPTIDLS